MLFWDQALGRIQAFKDVYIALDPGDCRTIFSPVQTYKSNGKVDQAGNVWRSGSHKSKRH